MTARTAWLLLANLIASAMLAGVALNSRPLLEAAGLLAPVQPVTALVVARDLPAGHTLTEDDVFEVPVLPSYLPDGTVVDPDAAVGRRLATSVLLNEWLLVRRLEPAPTP